MEPRPSNPSRFFPELPKRRLSSGIALTLSPDELRPAEVSLENRWKGREAPESPFNRASQNGKADRGLRADGAGERGRDGVGVYGAGWGRQEFYAMIVGGEGLENRVHLPNVHCPHSIHRLVKIVISRRQLPEFTGLKLANSVSCGQTIPQSRPSSNARSALSRPTAPT